MVWLLPQTGASDGCKEGALEVGRSSYELLASPLRDLAFTINKQHIIDTMIWTIHFRTIHRWGDHVWLLTLLHYTHMRVQSGSMKVMTSDPNMPTISLIPNPPNG